MASFDEAIPPGQAGKINATLRTAGYRGVVTKSVAVATNDPVQPSTTLTLKARVVGSVELVPNPSIALTVAGPDTRPGRLIVRKDPTETGTLKVGDVVASLPWMQVTAHQAADPEPQWEGLPATQPGDVVLEVVAQGDVLEPGSFQGNLTFTTGLPREPKVTIPIYAHVRGQITLATREVVVQPGVVGQVLVSVRKDVDIDAVTATAEPAAFKTTLERANATTLRLKIILDEKADPALVSGSVTLRAGKASATVQVHVVR